jgi:hypothetical protein
MDPRITFFLAIADYDDEDVTPFQGFAPSLIGFSWALRLIVSLPADLFDPASARSVRLARRVSGTGGWRWAPVLISSLEMIEITPASPLTVVFTNDDDTSQRVQDWSVRQAIRPLHICGHGRNALHPDDVSVESIARFCRQAILTAQSLDQTVDSRHWLDIMDKWQPISREPSKLHFQSHLVSSANEMVLMSEGAESSAGIPLNSLDDDDYIEAIVESASAVLEMRDEAGFPRAFLANPPRPDILLFAPAMYRHVLDAKLSPDPKVPKGLRTAARLMIRQTGYATRTDGQTMAEAMSGIGRKLFALRTQELRLQCAAVGMRGASTVAATIRLPPQVNRISGVVRQLAVHLRSNPDASQKTQRVFGIVQSALSEAVDESLMALIEESRTGIKIIADALLEWLPVQGLPLGLRLDASRINATPGGLTFGELINPIPIYLEPEAFAEVLVVSAFDADDPIKNHLRDFLRVYEKDGFLKPHVVEVSTVDAMVEALNSFRGAVVVFDGHGTHREDDVGSLNIGRERVDIWQLRGRARIPPVVLLSACDTHALDRSHATTANGFLSCGARAVLATVLPVRSLHSAGMITRLLFRAVEFSRAVHSSGRAVSWVYIVSSLFRLQITSDIVGAMLSKKLLTEDAARELISNMSLLINTDENDWFERLGEDARRRASFSPEDWQQFVNEVVAKSDVIRYVHLGSPETIIVTSRTIVEAHNGRSSS